LFFLFILFYFFIEALLANAYEQPRSPSPDAASSSSTTSSATHRLHLHTSSTPPHFERAATLTDFSALAKPHHRRSSDTIDDRPSNVNAASTTSGAGGIVAASSSSSSPSATLRSFLRRAPSTSDASRDANNANANATPSKQFDCSNLGLDLLPLARINLDVKRVCYTRSDVFVVFAFFFFFFFFFNSFLICFFSLASSPDRCFQQFYHEFTCRFVFSTDSQSPSRLQSPHLAATGTCATDTPHASRYRQQPLHWLSIYRSQTRSARRIFIQWQQNRTPQFFCDLTFADGFWRFHSRLSSTGKTAEKGPHQRLASSSLALC
jgi:hypothetical protein